MKKLLAIFILGFLLISNSYAIDITIKKTKNHRQNDKDIGGTYSMPPLATTKLLAIKIGCINNKKNGKKFLYL